MFDKIKQKVKQGKEWAAKHKTDIAMVGGYVLGAVVTAAVYTYEDNKQIKNTRAKYPKETGVLSMRKHSDGMYAGYGDSGPMVGDLSKSMIEAGTPEDAKIIGAIIYTKKQ